jgi:cob(I)alamin adenosyltransferase
MKGLVHIYTGNGKGKTTAAVGLGVRAYGRGFRVLMVQFLKGAETGELIALKKFEPEFILKRGKPINKFTWEMDEVERTEAEKAMSELFKNAVEASRDSNLKMLILDEVMASITTGFVDLQEVVAFIKNKPEKLEVVLTGRNAPKELVELADYVSEINPVKHPMEKGITARIGIES